MQSFRSLLQRWIAYHCDFPNQFRSLLLKDCRGWSPRCCWHFLCCPIVSVHRAKVFNKIALPSIRRKEWIAKYFILCILWNCLICSWTRWFVAILRFVTCGAESLAVSDWPLTAYLTACLDVNLGNLLLSEQSCFMTVLVSLFFLCPQRRLIKEMLHNFSRLWGCGATVCRENVI
jgi:hypothetical protein